MTHLELAVAPHEHIRFADSLVGLAGYVRTLLADAPRTLDELLAQLERPDSLLPSRPDMGELALAVTLLYAIGAARLTDGDRVELVA
ncbi:ABC-three component system middle component 6 [Acidithiobacillus caldus]|jgi:hypothetical protein|uniref:Uncharacterized protein n=1 Tax=Acidithiobacillus caldus (strain ATCC 51756 / DSM 8584 / KU) TaxID=637389 RepID=A0A060A0D5_ACICK|nr:ABC-three component system middle component 6 [Acidithiobacillus caldus]AIA55701.1 hypothetical protein Acaty_c1842 [Acidithiobacillus caldus ATCC 51756]MBU2729733.1 hypothetical protein [Acidithiobacillus caldus]MBU2736102.1 hypothetical protein [Acidithiobacillus caldus ATCC 51756]MBU2743879.1 hypothetical protein [Acidithiobacillus caldus]MBU2780232.1 hypothetical protein [Acidithiobacillus caldus]